VDKVTKSRISGKQATYVALAAAKYPPVRISASDNSSQSRQATQMTPNLPASVDGSQDVHHLPIHSGAQGLVGIVNNGEQGGAEK